MGHRVQAFASQIPPVSSTPVKPGITRISGAAQEFESVLLGQWLQEAETSFGTVPGADEDSDSCGEQMQGFAVQRLAGQLSAAGGIGIARLVEKGLVKASQREFGSNEPESIGTIAGRSLSEAAVRERSVNTAGSGLLDGSER
jgi:Rod binding domain-containing protein